MKRRTATEVRSNSSECNGFILLINEYFIVIRFLCSPTTTTEKNKRKNYLNSFNRTLSQLYVYEVSHIFTKLDDICFISKNCF